jgi:RNA polymerase sigma-70 factor (ECF subfamily)
VPAFLADVDLAVACLSGDPQALAAFDRLLQLEVGRAVRPIDPGLVDEVAQQVRERLLVGTPPRLGEYAGDGPLGAWLRTVAVRTALNARRPGAREIPGGSGIDPPLVDADPELALLRARYRDAFREAFSHAVAGLSPRERTVLRLTTLDGLTLARVGAIYGKDASTISRWLDQAKETVRDASRAHLKEQLQLPSAELDSLMRAADGELSVSLVRLLASQPAEDAG